MIELVEAEAKVSEVEMSFDELMNPKKDEESADVNASESEEKE